MRTHYRSLVILLMSATLSSLVQGQVKKSDPLKPKNKSSIEEKTKIHRLKTTKRSPFDAFAYLNRIPLKAEPGESPDDVAGRIFSRLANQEGRVLIKVPTGMDMKAYQGFKTFFRYDGKQSVGNCGACHTLPNFTDLKSHLGPGSVDIKPTLSLRNSKLKEKDLRRLIENKIQFGKVSPKKPQANAAYAKVILGEKDIQEIIRFLGLLKDVPAEEFRELILSGKVLDTSGLFDE